VGKTLIKNPKVHDEMMIGLQKAIGVQGFEETT
jgi:hypothetical protein